MKNPLFYVVFWLIGYFSISILAFLIALAYDYHFRSTPDTRNRRKSARFALRVGFVAVMVQIGLALLGSLTGCGGSDPATLNCHYSRFIHLDNSWEYVWICDNDREYLRCFEIPVIEHVIENNAEISSYRMEEVCFPPEARPMRNPE